MNKEEGGLFQKDNIRKYVELTGKQKFSYAAQSSLYWHHFLKDVFETRLFFEG